MRPLAGSPSSVGERAAQPALEALAAGDPGGEAAQGALEHLGLAHVAARVRRALPQRAVGIVPGEARRLRPHHADIREAEQRRQLLAVVLGLLEQLAGVEEDHRGRRIDGRHHVEQHGTLGAERGDQRGPAPERPLAQRGAQQRQAVELAIGAAQVGQMLEQAAGHRASPRGSHCWRSIIASVSRASSASARGRRRHAVRRAPRRSSRSAHSGPKRSASSRRMRAARPGLRPPVETVSSRSPRRTTDGLWKSQPADDVLDVDQHARRAGAPGEREGGGERQIGDPQHAQPGELGGVRQRPAQALARGPRELGGRVVGIHLQTRRRRPRAAIRAAGRRARRGRPARAARPWDRARSGSWPGPAAQAAIGASRWSL